MNARIAQISWTLFGLIVPLVIAAITVPSLLKTLGAERFGLLALAWGLIGYAGVLDLGIGRALTQKISKLKGLEQIHEIPNMVVTASRITLVAGLTGAFLIYIFSSALSKLIITSEDIPINQIETSIILLAIALPAQAMSATYRGINEAQLNFKEISLIRMILGIFNFAGPYLISLYTNAIHYAIFTLVISRLLALIAFYFVAKNSLFKSNIFLNSGSYSSISARSLFSFGAWVTLGNILSPVLIQADRFVISALLSAGAVTVYVLPYELVVQSLVLVGAVTTVIFPVLTKLIYESSADKWQAYFKRWLIYVTLGMGLFSISLSYFLPEILNVWLKDKLQYESIIIGRILCCGIFIYSIGTMLMSLQHAIGRVSLMAKFYIFEVIIFIPILFVMVKNYGAIGAAVSWVVRTVIDTLLLVWASWNDLKIFKKA